MPRTRQSAGILLYKISDGELRVLLAHPGGPFWKNKDEGSWSVPKGEFCDDETALDAAMREFEEETGIMPRGNFIELQPVAMKSGKIIYAWALEMEFDTALFKSNVFEMEWPPRSGEFRKFPEIDRVSWFSSDEALLKINPSQAALIGQLLQILKLNIHS